MNTDTEKTSGAKYEKRDFNMDFVWSFAWTLLGLMVAGMVITFLLFAGYSRIWISRDTPPSRLASTLPARPPAPRLQDYPAQELKEFHAREQEALHSYGWVEPNAGVVHIPIERAMELTLERGLPSRASAESEGGTRKKNSPPAKKK